MVTSSLFKQSTLAAAIGGLMLVSTSASAHLTYNAAGPNVSDNDNASWTGDGMDSAYAGSLPIAWTAYIDNQGGVPYSLTASSADAQGQTGNSSYILGAGAYSYLDTRGLGDFPPPNWGHSSDFAMFELGTNADVTITVSADLNSGLRSAFGVWSGWDTGGGSRHGAYPNNGAYDPMAAFPLGANLELINGSTSTWAYDDNSDGTATLTLTNLAAGQYTMIIGGYDGPLAGHSAGSNLAYSATISAATVSSPVPVPGAVWLFGTALMGFLGLSKRKGWG
ncbi:PEP-CTERM sorting domain-containing protein [Methylomonas albis]|uniref:PEP-CTERM sorting domain-containing protein n=1 Tax=Methylomonas albis TaxID=1854563 RepID=A0ABR9D406_9GAMM|nr:PEP-CTERM sorting domain-containing protein [Methylomonas albis]MBD9357854.1 PEP-CTERM sorting domain-containing protein [Methylomonas albis]